MRFAYADPPYLGCGKLYTKFHPDALIWDDIETHRRLVARLQDDYPDGWLMSCGSAQLPAMIDLCPSDIRIGAWVKGFAFFKPGVNPAYAWEPVIYRGGRKVVRGEHNTVRDWIQANNTFGRGLPGVKPRKFCRWLFELLNAQAGDQFDDLFPGSGAVGAAWCEFVGDRTQPEFDLCVTG